MRLVLSFMFLLLSMGHVSAQGVDNVFGFPSTEPGYSLGVSACYAGRIGDWLVVAGGCNFPTSGNKTYYAGIYAARIDSHVLAWRLVGMLPEPAAYGAVAASGDSLLFIGGNNRRHSFGTVYSVHLDARGERAVVRRVAGLPVSTDNMAVAQDGTHVYVVGGNQDARPSSDVWCADLAGGELCWKKLTTVPGSPRVQPVGAACGGKLYVWGGFFSNGMGSEVHVDGLSFDIATGTWSPLKAPRTVDGEEATLSGGIAWTCGGRILATGGVNKDIFLDAISGRYERVAKDDYLAQPIGWYRFSGSLYEFDATTGMWLKTRFAHQALARAGAVVVPTSVGCYYIGGELKPALRTPQIVLLSVD